MKTVAYGWRMTARAALRWTREAQKKIEERLEEIEEGLKEIENAPKYEREYLDAKAVWKALKSAEVRIADELNIRK